MPVLNVAVVNLNIFCETKLLSKHYLCFNLSVCTKELIVHSVVPNIPKLALTQDYFLDQLFQMSGHNSALCHEKRDAGLQNV